ncbi:hypothetical protein [Bradyrhizobium sp. 21]|uniref:hypothetical protein n=1 Tax=Bradyrhizobium sp. 21 TaxID=2782666 RepID=UPI001FF81480|nr:hypothetical protein [Bradyrhizobium sp. 21]MCK1388674.1 hypothetical protein [Bradyrhizobium sp. 21]
MDDILSELAALPAQLVVRASREIAAGAGLGWWQFDRRPREVLRTHWARLPFLRVREWFWPKSISEPVPSDHERLAANANLAWLFLFHPSGYLRAAALHSINVAPTSPFFLAALAWRLNDWVPQVREAARLCAERELPLVDARVAAVAAPYLLGRRIAWHRWTHEQDTLDQVFARKDVLEALAAQLRAGTTGPLAACLRHTMRFAAIDVHLIELARQAREPSVLALAYRCLISGRADWVVGFEWTWIDKVYFQRRQVPKLETRLIVRVEKAADLVKEAARDKSAIVRKIAADALIAKQCQLPDQESFVA